MTYHDLINLKCSPSSPLRVLLLRDNNVYQSQRPLTRMRTLIMVSTVYWMIDTHVGVSMSKVTELFHTHAICFTSELTSLSVRFKSQQTPPQSMRCMSSPSNTEKPQSHHHRRWQEIHHWRTIWSHLSDKCSEEEDDACNQDYPAESPKAERSHAQSNTIFNAGEKVHFVELSVLSESLASQFDNELRKSTDQYIAALRTLSHRFANNLPAYVEGSITRAPPEVLRERSSTPPPSSPWQLPSAGSSASLTSASSSIPTWQSSTEESTLSGRFWKASPTSSLSSSTGSCLRPYDMPFTLSTVSEDLDWLVDHSEYWTPSVAP